MIALVFCGDLKYCPYINRYVERLEHNNVEYNVYFWNRGALELELPKNYKYYGEPSDLGKSKWRKVIDFISFRRWTLNQIKKERPDGLIVLSTLTGVLLSSLLFSKNIRYIFDIRDYSYEHIKLFYLIERKVIKNSSFTAISSKGFKEFLPNHNYIIAHNFNRNDIIAGASFRKNDKKIKFVWNGVVRYFDFQKQYLDALKNDERFEIVFHGDGPELKDYQDYCTKNGFMNVTFTGSYNNAMKYELLKDASILNNCYGYLENAGSKLKYAVSNRFYDGAIFHIPQLVEPEGFKPRWTLNSGIGTNIRLDSDFANKLYNYYHSIDPTTFDISCEMVVKEVIAEDDNYIQKIDEFIIQSQALQ